MSFTFLHFEKIISERILFKGLDGLKAFFPSSPTLNLTATALQLIMELKESLCLSKITNKNFNRKNIFLKQTKMLE